MPYRELLEWAEMDRREQHAQLERWNERQNAAALNRWKGRR